MNNKTRFSALVLAVLMMVSLLSAFPMLSASAEMFSKDFTVDPETMQGDDYAVLNISGPSEVDLGDTFEITVTWKDIQYDQLGDVVGSADVYFNIDTRYIVYTGLNSINDLVIADDVEDMCSGPKTQATDDDYMKLVKLAVSFKNDAAREAVSETFVAKLGFKAVAAGTTDPATWNYAMLSGNDFVSGGYTVVVSPEEGVEGQPLDYVITVVDPNASSESTGVESDVTTGENTTEDATTEDTTSEDVTSEDTTSEDTTSEDTTSEDVTSEDTTSEDTTSEDTTTEDTTSEDVTSDDVTSDDTTSDDVTSDDTTSDDVSNDDTTSDDISTDDSSDDSSDDLSSEEPEIEEIDDMALENVAGDAEYKGTEGDDNGTSGNYCDIPIGEWLNFHHGKLNDGVIPEGDSYATMGQNVEIWNAAMGSGYNTVIFKLAEAVDVRKVNVYMNTRSNNDNTGYPEKIEIYVGNDEDMANATLMGEAVTTDPEGAVRKYTVNGNVNGQYVFIYFTVGAKWRITLSEVEVMTVGETQNIAGYGDYKGSGISNGTGNYGEENWNEYHDGKLTDGSIAADATNLTMGENVEVAFNAGYSAGTVYVYNKFDSAVLVNEVIVYMNQRTTAGNRQHPQTINIYVGDSEDVATATLLGTATTTDEGYVRAYKAVSDKLLKGTYVIVEAVMASGTAMIAFNEIQIMGYGEAPAAPVLPELSAPVLSGNLTQKETFVAPTITWEAVEGAVSYDAYIDGILVTEGITDTSYIPEMDPVITYAGNTSFTKVQIVAKGDGVAFADSALSESYDFFYVEKPLDLRGNKVESADILIDVGHGGSQPGACGVYADGSERQEKVDTLNMALKVGEYFEALGYTVAYTRITDTDVGLMARAAMANAGDFKAYICIHRNSFEDARANGIETLYLTGNAENEKFAQSIQDEMIALGGFTNRGLKPRDNLVVLNNTTAKTPLCLVELAFISNENDNNMFDEKFDDLALAIVKGTMKYLGDEPGVSGTVIVGDAENDYAGEEIVVDLSATVGDTFNADIKFDLSSRLGIGKLYCVAPDGTQADILYNTSAASSPKDAINANGSYSISFEAAEAGTYTYSICLEDAFGGVYTIATINVTVEEPAALKGDVNGDGKVNNLDATVILKYDAGIVDEIAEVGDVNGDGKINNLDATAVLKYDAGIIDEL